ncbi:hypothetical protein A3860_06235 [Niastella vici]|uniref:Lipid A deacylase LpxR family protein n=1 Tax=Niastella vici TaxID=1703345 RepID=A0A1V9FSU4_9BACT|nr:lipid A deacylase LpxR family protein [Niastella vici]OQP61306.1 hypothetical protein A3860_06235 [Niastella vici]
MQWGRFITGCLIGCCVTGTAWAQQPKAYRHLLRVYEDNDNINIRGVGTDQGYTNGSRIDYFFIKDKPSRFFLDRIMPKAGDSSLNTWGWGLMQVIMTPKNIIKRIPDKNDFPYAGALFATHTLHSTNSIKKYNIQTEFMFGVMGPPSLAKQTQRTAHRIVRIVQPGGWDYQLKTDPLLNMSVAGEKELVHINNSIEFIGGAQGFAGTALNGASLYSLIRIGRMTPYFDGYGSQFATPKGTRQRKQFYFILRPSVEWVLYNALIDGGVFNHSHEPVPGQPNDPNNDEPKKDPMVRKRFVAKLDYGMALSLGRVCLSFTQTTMTPMVKGTDIQEVGNVSVFLAW